MHPHSELFSTSALPTASTPPHNTLHMMHLSLCTQTCMTPAQTTAPRQTPPTLRLWPGSSTTIISQACNMQTPHQRLIPPIVSEQSWRRRSYALLSCSMRWIPLTTIVGKFRLTTMTWKSSSIRRFTCCRYAELPSASHSAVTLNCLQRHIQLSQLSIEQYEHRHPKRHSDPACANVCTKLPESVLGDA